MDELDTFLADRLHAVEDRVRAACARSGRTRESVTMVAVTKTVSAEVAARLPRLGILDLGESRPKELWRKAASVPVGVRWHLVGHLQRNKIAQTLPFVSLIHSADSVRLLDALEVEAARQQRHVAVLLEVNASREPNKHGFPPEELAGVLVHLQDSRHVRVRGLMTMAALTEDLEETRPTFAALRELRDRLRRQLNPPHDLCELSMGMTNDFEVAVEEGATLVRIGTALFEGLPGSAEGT